MTLNKKEQICNLLKGIEAGVPASVSVRFCDSKNIKIIPIVKLRNSSLVYVSRQRFQINLMPHIH